MAETKNYICAGMIRTDTAIDGETRLYIAAGIPRQFIVPVAGGRPLPARVFTGPFTGPFGGVI